MNSSKSIVMGAALVGLVLFCLSSSAQIAVDDLSRAVDSQDLDSYWLDQRMWTEYGYKPHASAQPTRFTNLPSYFAGKNYYASGINMPTPSMMDPLNKNSTQIIGPGVWH